MNILLIEDEPFQRKTLKVLLEKHFSQNWKIFEAGDPIEGTRLIQKYKPDLVFLDIRLPFFSGLTLLEQLEEINFGIIFTTDYPEYAPMTYRYSTTYHFLEKPIAISDFKEAVNRFLKRRNEIKKYEEIKQERQRLHNLLWTMNTDNSIFYCNTHQGAYSVSYLEIIRFEAQGNSTFVYYENNKMFKCSKTLKSIENLVQEFNFFFRVHQAHIVNYNYIEKFIHKGNGGCFILKNKNQVEVSRSKKKPVLTWLEKCRKLTI